jgi:hypothetical protein
MIAAHLKIKRRHMTIDLEDKVIKYTKKLKKLTKNLVEVSKKIQTNPQQTRDITVDKDTISVLGPFNFSTANPEAVKDYLTQFHQEIMDYISEIIKESKDKKKEKAVKNPFYKYLLFMVLTYNRELRRFANLNKPIDPKVPKKLPDILREIGAFPILHPILAAGSITEVEYKVTEQDPNNPIFTPPDYKLVGDHPRYLVPGKQDEKHPEEYHQRNTKIATDTNLARPGHPYMSMADKSLHDEEEKLYNEAHEFISRGEKEKLTPAHYKVLEFGTYFRGYGPIEFYLEESFPRDPQHSMLIFTNGGHATCLLQMGTIGLPIWMDILRYGCQPDIPIPGVGGLLSKLAGNIGYHRHNAPGVTAELLYAVGFIDFTTHDHYDHDDHETQQEAGDRLKIVAKGMDELHKSWNISKDIVALSWGDYVDITVTHPLDPTKKITTRVYSGFSYHASGRKYTPDAYNRTLFQSGLFREIGCNYMVLATGDTGAWFMPYLKQLEYLIIMEDSPLLVLANALGPDRSREDLYREHQSTPEGLCFGGKVNGMNVRGKLAKAKREGKTIIITKKDLFDLMPHSDCYHQACFRLGNVHFHDVYRTITSWFVVLKSYKNQSLSTVAQDLKNQLAGLKALQNKQPVNNLDALTNYSFSKMDNFEREGLIEFIEIYMGYENEFNLTIDVEELSNAFQEHVHIIPIGGNVDMKANPPKFEYDYRKLILQRDPNPSATKGGMYEEYLLELLKKEGKNKNVVDLNELMNKYSGNNPAYLVETFLKFYISIGSTVQKKNLVNDFLDKLPKVKNNVQDLINTLIQLDGQVREWKTYDNEEQSTQGHLDVALLILSGLLDPTTGYKDNFREDLKVVAKRNGIQIQAAQAAPSISAPQSAIYKRNSASVTPPPQQTLSPSILLGIPGAGS